MCKYHSGWCSSTAIKSSIWQQLQARTYKWLYRGYSCTTVKVSVTACKQLRQWIHFQNKLNMYWTVWSENKKFIVKIICVLGEPTDVKAKVHSLNCRSLLKSASQKISTSVALRGEARLVLYIKAGSRAWIPFQLSRWCTWTRRWMAWPSYEMLQKWQLWAKSIIPTRCTSWRTLWMWYV